jgi:hypothetical protein
LRLAKLLGSPAFHLTETFTVTDYNALFELSKQNHLQRNALTAIEAAKQLTRELDAKAKAEMRTVFVTVAAHLLAATILHTTKQIILSKVKS